VRRSRSRTEPVTARFLVVLLPQPTGRPKVTPALFSAALAGSV
jgi:hypothetical protein